MQRKNLGKKLVGVNTTSLKRILKQGEDEVDQEASLTSFTPNHALTLIAVGGSSFGRSRSPISITTRNIFSASGRSPAVYAVSANWRKVKGF